MTKLGGGDGVARETASRVQGRPIVAAMRPLVVVMRLKGLRYTYAVPWEAVWDLGAKLEARRRMEEGRRRS